MSIGPLHRLCTLRLDELLAGTGIYAILRSCSGNKSDSLRLDHPDARHIRHLGP